jgi:hypothetical protein
MTDYESYGYHGDDGGIFHGNGRKFDGYGSPFGRDDIIGCGIDFINKSIFYTLNGNFLGIAFQDVDTTIPYHATVGIDASVEVIFNFGKTPFEFNLMSYINNQNTVIINT